MGPLLRAARPILLGVAGLALVVAFWQFAATAWFTAPSGRAGAVPPPFRVAGRVVDDLAEARYWRALGATVRAAITGYVIAAVVAVVLGVVVLVVARLESFATQVGIVAACVPSAAIAPVVVLLSPAGSRAVAVVLAALAVSFPMIVGVLLGLRATNPTQIDLIRAYGGSELTVIRRVRLVSALPAVLAALKIGAPTAILGAIVGEFFMIGVDSGAGIILMSLQYSGDYVGMWAVAVICTLAAASGFALLHLAERRLAPWTSGLGAEAMSGPPAPGRSTATRRALAAATTILTVGVLVALWWLAIGTADVSPYITKTPLDVLRYLFVDDAFDPASAAERRRELCGLLAVTLRHAGIGLGCGVTAGLAAAIGMATSATARSMFLPLSLFMQTIPLIAMAPVIYAVFGSGVVTAAVIAGVVTFFPLLLNLMTGLRSAGDAIEDVVTAYGGSRVDLLRRVALPASLPYLFAALRIAVPATVSAAMLYEFLFTFEGFGAAMLTSKAYSNYGLLWTIVALSTAVSIALYALVAGAGRVVLAHRYPGGR